MVFVPQTKQLPDGFAVLSMTSPLTLINQADFSLNRLSKIIGVPNLARIATSNAQEIALRQDIVCDLTANPKLRQLLSVGARTFELAISHDDFVKDYQVRKRTEFWTFVHSLHNALKQAYLTSSRLIELRDYLSDNLQLEAVDRAMAAQVSAQVNNMVTGTGSFTMELVLRSGQSMGYGKKTYISLFRRHGPQTLAVLQAALRAHRNRWWWPALPSKVKSMQDRKFIQSVVQATEDYQVASRLADQAAALVSDVCGKVYSQDDDQFREDLEGAYNVTCALTTDPKGTRLRILNVARVSLSETTHQEDLDVASEQLNELWPEGMHKQISFDLQEGNNWLENRLKQNGASVLVDALLEADPDCFDWKFFTPYWETEYSSVSRYVSMSALWEMPNIKPASTAMSALMGDVNSSVSDLSLFARAVTNVIAFSEMHDVSLTLPELVEEGHIIAFDELVPVQVYEERPADQEPMKLMPITGMQPLGGSMVVLTGDHGGGKTTICEMLAQQICLAQVGLPVFGKAMKWSPRESIGLSLLEREAGTSTMQLFMRKLERLLAAVKEVPRSRLLLIMDEVGTGTSPDRGEQIGRTITDNFTDAGIDLLFATQITQVARYAVENGAASYQVNRRHQLSEGIGEPDIDELMDEFGVNEGFAALRAA